MKLFGLAKLLALLVAIDLATIATAVAQPASPPSSKADDAFTYYYRDPRPERLVDVLESLGKKPRDWIAYPAVAGILAVVFATQPGWIGKLIPAQLDARLATTIAAAFNCPASPSPRICRSAWPRPGRIPCSRPSSRACRID